MIYFVLTALGQKAVLRGPRRGDLFLSLKEISLLLDAVAF